MKIKMRGMKEPEEIAEDDIYTDNGVSQKAEDDEISDFEEAFMRGWLCNCL